MSAYWTQMLKLRLRFLLKREGRRIRDLADLCDVSDPLATMWLNPHRPEYPGLRHIAEICAEFDVTPDWLLGYSQDKDFDEWRMQTNEHRKNHYRQGN